MATKFSFNGLFGSISRMIMEGEVVEKNPSKNPRQKAHDDEIQNAIIVLAAEVIRCDKNLASSTESYIQEFFISQFGTGVKHKAAFVNDYLNTGTEPFTRMACKELKLLTTYSSRLHITGFLFGVADSDDFINAKEIRCIRRIATYLDVSDEDFKQLKSDFIKTSNPFKLLDIDEDASLDQVKAAYRKMVLKFHPDKHGNDAETNAKFRQIQKAFETIKQMKLK